MFKKKLYINVKNNNKCQILFVTIEDIYKNFDIFYKEDQISVIGKMEEINGSIFIKWPDMNSINSLESFFTKRNILKSNFEKKIIFKRKSSAILKLLNNLSKRLLNLEISELNSKATIPEDIETSLKNIEKEISYIESKSFSK